MIISRETLDDVLLALYPMLLGRSSSETVLATRGETAEIIGALIEIKQPRARLSRSETRGKLFSSLGEFLWYLSRGNRLDFIERYVPPYREESEMHLIARNVDAGQPVDDLRQIDEVAGKQF
jgi:thymidylate synthase